MCFIADIDTSYNFIILFIKYLVPVGFGSVGHKSRSSIGDFSPPFRVEMHHITYTCIPVN